MPRLDGFRPSFSSAPPGALRAHFEQAFVAFRQEDLNDETRQEYTTSGRLGPLALEPLRFGYLPAAGTGDPSGDVPYEVDCTFNGQELVSLTITLFLLNPRVFI